MRACRHLLGRKPGDYRWIAIPGPLPMAHYDEAIALMIERGRAIPAVQAVCDFGPIRFPGLSDIDLLFVLRDDFDEWDNLRPLLRDAVPPRYHNVILHDPYFVQASQLPYLFDWMPLFEVNTRWSRSEAGPPGMRNRDPIRRSLFLMDIIADAYPWEFIAFLEQPELSERELMGRVKGVAYCIGLFSELGGEPSKAMLAFSSAIADLRRDFFGLDPPVRRQTLLGLAIAAIAISHELAQRTSELLQQAWSIRLSGKLLLYCNRGAGYFADPAPAEPLYDQVKLRRFETYSHLPAIFGWLLAEYAAQDGPFSRWLSGSMINRLHLQNPPPARIAEAIAMRARRRNTHLAWLDTMGLGLPGSMVFGYRSRQDYHGLRGLKSALGRWLDLARRAMLRRRLLAYDQALSPARSSRRFRS